ncbi:HAD-IIIA family hydrolase [candidate division KSB1 bacterium]|nr:HAD-IIIA family hydrolase [candidate division KSB1 bacterium]
MKKLPLVKLFVLDSDGVLTDGAVYISDKGDEFRRFHILDGLGLKRIMQKGIQVAVISSAKCEAVRHRMRVLGIEQVYLGVDDKLKCLKMICGALGITFAETAYMGDDLADVPVLKTVGFACAPANAVDDVKQIAHYICKQKGGQGAVREVCDRIWDGLKIED